MNENLKRDSKVAFFVLHPAILQQRMNVNCFKTHQLIDIVAIE